MSRLTAFIEDLRLGHLANRLAHSGDIVLAVFVLGIVAMMLVPLPTPLLDVLLTTNIALGATILVVAIYVPDATRIASFPAILLLTTLFRLGLNVSTTRLILLDADAGEVVRAFGSFVAGGNLVVGLVIFLILTVIQFVVITKGAERVAEVAARFTLDALPGRQLAIDADFRAGLADLGEMQRRRNALQRESQLYGAMDGAMKFVKGDAIAGIVITVLNLAGGLAIGVFQRGMEPERAVRVFSLLTIGDGLVSQIPALLISVSAGMVVTRVASEDRATHLGHDIGAQLLAEPRAIAIVAGLFAVLALVPGLPAVPFLLLALMAGGLAATLIRARARRGDATARSEVRAEEGTRMGPDGGFAVPLLVTVGPALAARLPRNSRGRLLGDETDALRSEIQNDLGFLLPPVDVRVANTVDPEGFIVLLDEAPVHAARIPVGRRLVDETAESLAILQIGAEAAVDPASGRPAAWIATQDEAAALAAGLRVRSPADLAQAHLGAILRRHAHELLGLQETQALLDRLAVSHPDLVAAVVPEFASVFQTAEVLRRLLRERVPIRDLPGILEALAEAARHETDPLELSEHVRTRLGRTLCARSAREGRLRVHTVDPEIELAIRESIRRTTTGSYLGLSPDMEADIRAAVRRVLGPTGTSAVVLTEGEVRPYLRRLVELDFPNVEVLATREIAAEFVLEPVGVIALSGVGTFG